MSIIDRLIMLRIYRTFSTYSRSLIYSKRNFTSILDSTKKAERISSANLKNLNVNSSKHLVKVQCSSISHTPWTGSHEDGSVPAAVLENENDVEFGSLAQKHDVSVFKIPIDKVIPEEDDNIPQRRRSNNTSTWYFLQCRKLAKEKKVVECVQFLEERMLKQDRVKPLEPNFTVVIGALGRIGYVKKAFRLYYQMRDRALTPSVATYTALFNAVANSPYGNDIKKATQLYNELHKKKIRLNRIVYNSAIKAFGVHGSMEQMMRIFRESIVAGFEPDCETFNMIFFSLAKNEESGFRYAIEVWRQMVMLGVKPSGKTILYFLKVLKSCRIGDLEIANRKLIEELPDPTIYKDFFKKHMRNVYWLKGQESFPKRIGGDENEPQDTPILHSAQNFLKNDSVTVDMLSNNTNIPADENNFEQSESGKMTTSDYSATPDSEMVLELEENIKKDDASIEISGSEDVKNLLTLPFLKDPDRSIKLRQCHFPWHRLELIGGHRYIFDLMREYDIEPTNMVLSTLVQCSQPSTIVEDEIMKFAEDSRIQLDIDFYNMILHKKAKRLNHRDLKKVLRRMVSNGLSPNYRTWCIVALSCVEGKEGIALLNEMKQQKISIDRVLFNSLICAAMKNKTAMEIVGYKGVYGYDYRYLVRLIHEMKKLEIKADPYMIKALEEASDWPEGYNRWHIADINFEKKVFYFRKIYGKWLEEVEMIPDSEPFSEFQKEGLKRRTIP